MTSGTVRWRAMQFFCAGVGLLNVFLSVVFFTDEVKRGLDFPVLLLALEFLLGVYLITLAFLIGKAKP